jgi:hypothetical protein
LPPQGPPTAELGFVAFDVIIMYFYGDDAMTPILLSG